MRISKGFFPTVKEVPADAVIPSHQLMIRAGLMRQLGAGIFSFLPLGYAVMKKVMQIIREEMDAIGGQEFHLPALNPIEVWEETGRVKAFGDILFHIKNRPLVLAPTHEEIITHIARNHIRSYKDLPQIWYQIQTKFRNEPRPKSGVLRGRQFTMKDSYSMDSSSEGLDVSYDLHAEAYKKIYTRCGLKFFIVGASSGAMGGSGSQEFMIESDAGEDTVALCDHCHYAANLEVATSKTTPALRSNDHKVIEEIHTPNIKTIDQLADFLKIETSKCAKSLVYISDNKPVLIFMLGNDQLNETKLQTVLGADVRPAQPEELLALTGADAGSIGPIGLKAKFKIIADKRLEGANGMYSGANKNDYHIGNIDFNRDVNAEGYYDLRTVEDGEPCPNCTSPLRIVKGIEIGHIFKLGTKYSVSLGANFLDESGKEHPIIMGSYGIGVERIVACHIEQHHDANGIIWSKAIAPYDVHLICVNSDSEAIVKASEELYNSLQSKGLSVLFDDRTSVSAGFKFKDADLLGMPLQVVVGERNMKNQEVELKERATGKRWTVNVRSAVDAIVQFVQPKADEPMAQKN
jgi:prolyl-tRNA synthetase